MRNNAKIIAGAIIAAVFLVLMIAGLSYAMNRDEVGPCTVSGKESVMMGGNNQYRVYTEECGVFTIKDTIVGLRFNSADVYGALSLDEAYNFRTQGFRLEVASLFPNILDYEIDFVQ